MKKIALLCIMTLVLWMILPIERAKAVENCQTIVGVGVICLSVEDGRAAVTGPLGIDLSLDVPQTIVEVPVPVITYVEVPGPTVTATRTVTETETNTVAVAPEQTTTPMITAPPTASDIPEQVDDQPARVITKPVEAPGESTTEMVVKNAAIGLGYILLGLLVGLALLFLAYRIGRTGRDEQERSFNSFVRDLTDLTMIRKR